MDETADDRARAYARAAEFESWRLVAEAATEAHAKAEVKIARVEALRQHWLHDDDPLRPSRADVDALGVALSGDGRPEDPNTAAIQRVREVVHLYRSCGPKQQSTRDVLDAVDAALRGPTQAEGPFIARAAMP